MNIITKFCCHFIIMLKNLNIRNVEAFEFGWRTKVSLFVVYGLKQPTLSTRQHTNDIMIRDDKPRPTFRAWRQQFYGIIPCRLRTANWLAWWICKGLNRPNHKYSQYISELSAPWFRSTGFCLNTYLISNLTGLLSLIYPIRTGGGRFGPLSHFCSGDCLSNSVILCFRDF